MEFPRNAHSSVPFSSYKSLFTLAKSSTLFPPISRDASYNFETDHPHKQTLAGTQSFESIAFGDKFPVPTNHYSTLRLKFATSTVSSSTPRQTRRKSAR